MLSSKSAQSMRCTFALNANVTAASIWPRHVALASCRVGGADLVLVRNTASPLIFAARADGLLAPRLSCLLLVVQAHGTAATKAFRGFWRA
ncbi:MAG: hypothetical protein ACLPTZ_17190 [Beijerinckiaceae bacterium]